MTTDPYDGYVDAMKDLVNLATDRLWDDYKDEHSFHLAIEESVADFEEKLAELADNTWTSRSAIESQFREHHEPAFRAIDSMIAIAYSVSRLLTTGYFEDESRPPHAVTYSSSMILIRAISVSHEIFAMLRAGFPTGALARWRTLYELDVVAAVLRKGNRWTAARYVNHRWIIASHKQREYTYEYWESIRSEVQRKTKLFIRRYGQTYNGTYGWAAELTKRTLGVKQPKFGHLEEIAQLRQHKPYLLEAHHGVHADAIGGLQTIDGDGLLHSGARYEGVAWMCLVTTMTLAEIVESVLRTWDHYGRSHKLAILLGLCDELDLTLQREFHYLLRSTGTTSV